MPSVMLRLDKGIGRLPYLAAGVVLFAIKIAIDSQLAQASVHRCFFTTGSFIEPIEIWDPPRELRFGVSASPDPMTEWTLWDGRAAVREADSSTGTAITVPVFCDRRHKGNRQTPGRLPTRSLLCWRAWFHIPR